MTINGFKQRLELAVAFEEKVTAALTERGWVAVRLGQGQLSDGMRDMLRRVETAVRYMPDIIAAKRFDAGVRVVFIDAKAGDRYKDTGNHDVEAAALVGAELWRDYSRCDTYFVFANGDVITPAVFREWANEGRFRGSGSGTPFYLCSAMACDRFDSIFGARDAWMDGAA